jgi:hypothetical protein
LRPKSQAPQDCPPTGSAVTQYAVTEINGKNFSGAATAGHKKPEPAKKADPGFVLIGF